MGRHVAILGGGAGALAAALELTDPDLPPEQRCEVTVYTMGWRLGGKGASGRNPVTGQRIEEHGLHIWFGFYDNGFEVMKRVFAEAARETGPLRTIDDAFKPCNTVVLYRELDDGTWRPKAWTFPERPGERPGIGNDPSRLTIIKRLLEWLGAGRPDAPGVLPGGVEQEIEAFRTLIDRLADLDGDGGPATKGGGSPFPWGKIAAEVLEGLGLDLEAGAEELLRAATRLAEHARDAVWPSGATLVPGDVGDYAMALDLVLAVLNGVREDDLLSEGFGAIDQYELSDWLARHGARPETVATSPLLRAFYQLVFGYREGDRSKPCVAAGKAVQALIRIVATYKGAVLWKMQAGMGDAIFAPIYEVLDRRGVRFEFFHRVEKLELDADREHVQRIRLTRQVEVEDGNYNPLVDVAGLACWPSEPLFDQLVAPDRTRNYEGDYDLPGVGDVVLEREKDFDDVVLGIPIGGLRDICADLVVASERWGRAFQTAETVATQALQLWICQGPRLSWRWRDESTVAGAYVPPLDTYCDMSHLLSLEDWKAAGGPAAMHCAYFCGVMAQADACDGPARANELAREHGLRHVRERLAPLWPGAYGPDGSFDWSLLHDEEDRTGEARFEAQYWRANTERGDRYVLTPPGSVVHRLRPDDTGFANLAVAGDWTRNGICGGSVEAAITSGRLAARGLTGFPLDIAGLDGWLCEDVTPAERVTP